MIMAGAVTVGGQVSTKAGQRVSRDAVIEVVSDPNPFVSRGGLKLRAALDRFGFNPSEAIAIDVGASTGGFTDCLLQRGAAKVYAVDVGYGQLAWKLRQDERVVVIERQNARYLTSDHVPEPCNLVVMDASFISLAKIMPAILPLLEPGANVIAMIKPQFEGDRSEIGKGGVVRDQAVRSKIIDRAIGKLVDLSLTEVARADSELAGPKGNVECFVWLRYG